MIRINVCKIHFFSHNYNNVITYFVLSTIVSMSHTCASSSLLDKNITSQCEQQRNVCKGISLASATVDLSVLLPATCANASVKHPNRPLDGRLFL